MLKIVMFLKQKEFLNHQKKCFTTNQGSKLRQPFFFARLEKMIKFQDITNLQCYQWCKKMNTLIHHKSKLGTSF